MKMNKKKKATIVVIIILLASTIVYFSLPSSTTIHSPTSPTIYNTEPDLNLTFSLSQSSLNKGEGLNITVALFNNESHFLMVNVSDNWPYFLGEQNSMTMGPCGGNLPFGIVILNEDYNLTTYSQGSPLTIYEPGIYMCPVEYPISSYEFLPLSNHTLLISSENPPINYTLESSIFLNGSWFYVGNQLEFRNFSPGIYTVVAADEWGAVQIVHFSVDK